MTQPVRLPPRTKNAKERKNPVVLVADDDATVRLLARESLEDEGFEVGEAADGVEALAAFQALSPDLVLLDLMMPRMDGYATCKALRQFPDGEHVPVLILTGLTDMESIDRAYKVGATDFATKPVNWLLLRHRVQYVLRSGHVLRALRQSEERYALASRGANDGLWDWDLQTDQLYFSPRWKSMLGYREEDIGNRREDWLKRVHPQDLNRVKSELQAHVSGLTTHLESEHRILAADGNYRWVQCRGVAVRDETGKPYRMAGSQTDISQRKQAEARLVRDALHDSLTGLPNRALFLDYMKRTLERARRRSDYVFAVVFIDIDHFKAINDSHGHLLGDKLLLEIGRRIRSSLRSGDLLARFAGDEFMVLLNDVRHVKQVTEVVERIQQRLSTPLDLDGNMVTPTASVGIAMSTEGYHRPEDMLDDADTAMYCAKSLGRARYELFDPEARTPQSVLMAELQTALARDEFVLHYQPIVSVGSGRVAGFEALLRWKHSSRGLLLPEQFMAAAQESGLIVPIGHWVLRAARKQMREWRYLCPSADEFFMSVNMSSQELMHPDLTMILDSLAQETGFSPRSLRLEVPENSLMNDVDAAIDVITRLKARNIALSIDNFGSGQSSLHSLHRVPFEALKIGRYFNAQLESGDDGNKFLKATLALAHGLGSEVVAQGIESIRALKRVRGLQCDYAQGNLILEPQDADETAGLIMSLNETGRVRQPRKGRIIPAKARRANR